eukprot:snap_masked-scaffold_8-processed-gene-7.43-mRNA-1 protein AED:0.01 eAED:0.01 QI:0/-1/0/1/-1/1/1/0/262
MKIRYVGFCGVDDSVDIASLLEITNKYSEIPIEWGFLFRPEKEGEARFISAKNLPGVVGENGLRATQPNKHFGLAGHLCSTRCEEVLRGETAFLRELRSLGFKRVQINATRANGVNVDLNSLDYKKLLKLFEEVNDLEYIIQINDETQIIADTLADQNPVPKNISFLFDSSKGTGKVIGSFPEPTKGIKAGYAGGISPSNVMEILTRMAKDANVQKCPSTWIDMESSLRVIKAEKDIFSLEQVDLVLQSVKQLIEGKKIEFV